MDKVLNCQISLFGSYINIQPQIELVDRVVKELNEYNMIPGIATVSVIDTATQQMTTENRLKMETQDQAWQVVFLQDRIDINYVYTGEETYYTNFNEVLEKAKNICTKVFSIFPDTTGARIAVNAKFLFREMDNEQLQDHVRRFVIIPRCFSERKISEMSLHLNSPITICINSINEECNCIIDIIDIVGIDSKTQEVKKRNAFGIDINTDKDNKEMKYSLKDIIEFTDSVLPIFTQIMKEIIGE